MLPRRTLPCPLIGHQRGRGSEPSLAANRRHIVGSPSQQAPTALTTVQKPAECSRSLPFGAHAPDLGSSIARCGGSSPSSCTRLKRLTKSFRRDGFATDSAWIRAEWLRFSGNAQAAPTRVRPPDNDPLRIRIRRIAARKARVAGPNPKGCTSRWKGCSSSERGCARDTQRFPNDFEG